MARIAAQLYTIRQSIQTAADLAASLKKLSSYGYTAVQTSGLGPIPDAEVKAIVDEAGMVICNTHVSPTEKVWTDVGAVIAQHRLWECSHVAIGGMPAAYRGEGEAGFHRFAADASRLGETLHAAGLTFSYHNHSFELEKFNSKTGLEIIYSESDPRYLQAEIDTYWIQHGGADPVEWIRRVKGRMPVIHFKDMGILEGKQQYMAIGEGNLNWPAILAACADAGVSWYAIEQDSVFAGGDPFDCLRRSYQFLSQLGFE
jgi:sugar phosphate isomerase/epimerase